jgi:hypothetical protein
LLAQSPIARSYSKQLKLGYPPPRGSECGTWKARPAAALRPRWASQPIRTGLLETLTSLPGPVGFVFLDGWKDLCLPVPWMLEPKFAPGSAGHFRQ